MSATDNDLELLFTSVFFTSVPCTHREGKAEELPFPDGYVDLLTAASAVHWFDQPKFLAEASRVLKPRGCMAVVDFQLCTMSFHYQNCGDKLSHIFEEVGYTETFYQKFMRCKNLE